MPTKVKLLSVSDLHRRASLFSALRKAVLLHKPGILALVGDFLHAFDDNVGRLTVVKCAKELSSLPCSSIVFVPGNHEDYAAQQN